MVGVKMMSHAWLKKALGENFNLYVLGMVLGILALGVVASLMFPRKDTIEAQAGTKLAHGDELEE
jgi:predicted tellurium resistance membrane protein TerC